jgi:O-methyltransferase/methyltransferase family protein
MLPLIPLLKTLWRGKQSERWPQMRQVLSNGFSEGARRALLPVRKARSRRPSNPQPPPLFQMATSYWISQAIYVAAKLGIADHVHNGPKSCFELADLTESDELALSRLMRALSSVGIFTVNKDGRFELSPMGTTLQTGIPGSLRNMVITLGELHYQAWGNLLYNVKTGATAFDDLFGAKLFLHLKQNHDDADSFHSAMTDFSGLISYAVLLAYDFSKLHTLVDVGGGRGQFLRTVLQVNPQMTGIVFDQESVIESAKEHLKGDASAGRCTLVAGDFFESVPAGADAYVMCGVIHDWDDEHSIAILRNCHRAMPDGGRLLVVESVVPDGNETCFSKFLDLNMMVMSGGRERSREQFSDLFAAAGFELATIVRTVAPLSVMECTRKKEPSEEAQVVSV